MRIPFRKWIWPGVVAVCALLAAAFGEPARTALRWQRDLLLAEPWRLLTGHFVHLDWPHLLLNLAGLGVLWALVGDTLSARRWTLVALAGAAAISGGLLLAPVGWYVGLSGVLHALLAAGAVAMWSTWRIGAAGLLAFLLVKGVLEYAGFSTGDGVVAEAHWLGAIGGFCAGIICVLTRRRTR
ncbi:MAG: rhombosortase [Xanthomonadaceae bacterium]|nr:rhombosortase [Xanthomonadaceae bacterium]